MADQEYPEYVARLLAEAEALLVDEEEPDPSEAAALCFEVLALFPEHSGAAELVYRAYCDPWLIRDNRRAIERQIDEWDDRPWQQRPDAVLPGHQRRGQHDLRLPRRHQQRGRRDQQQQLPTEP